MQGQTNFDSFSIVVWDLLFKPEEIFIDVVDGVAPGASVYAVQQNLQSAAVGNRLDSDLLKVNYY